MKILVFSDIHGSLPVVALMNRLAAEYDPALIILLGDVLYHGPRNRLPEGYDPKRAAQALAPLAQRLIAIKGNCDSEVDETVLPFPLASPLSWIVDAGARSSGLPLRICATHGHIFNPQNLPPLQKGDVLLFGHTHVPMAETSAAGVHCCNPGSPALPKEGYPASYGLFQDGIFSILGEDGEAFLQLDCR